MTFVTSSNPSYTRGKSDVPLKYMIDYFCAIEFF